MPRMVIIAGNCQSTEGGSDAQKNVATKKETETEGARFSCTNEHKGWSTCYQGSSAQRAQTTCCLMSGASAICAFSVLDQACGAFQRGKTLSPDSGR